MAIENLSTAANILVKLLKNKYHVPTNKKVVHEMLKIVESNEKKLTKYSKNFSLKNKEFFENHGQEIIKLSNTYGAIQIRNFLLTKYSNTPSLSTLKRFLKEVQSGKSKGQ